MPPAAEDNANSPAVVSSIVATIERIRCILKQNQEYQAERSITPSHQNIAPGYQFIHHVACLGQTDRSLNLLGDRYERWPVTGYSLLIFAIKFPLPLDLDLTKEGRDFRGMPDLAIHYAHELGYGTRQRFSSHFFVNVFLCFANVPDGPIHCVAHHTGARADNRISQEAFRLGYPARAKRGEPTKLGYHAKFSERKGLFMNATNC